MGPSETYLFGVERAKGILLGDSMPPKKLTPMLDLNIAPVNMQKLAHPIIPVPFNGPGILACDSGKAED